MIGKVHKKKKEYFLKLSINRSIFFSCSILVNIPLAHATCIDNQGEIICSEHTNGTFQTSKTNIKADVSGNWTATGALLGLLYTNPLTVKTISVNNKGEQVWDDASYGNSGTAGRAAFNLNYTDGSIAEEISYNSSNNSKITINLSPQQKDKTQVLGVAAYATKQLGKISINNGGSITMHANTVNSSDTGMGGIATIGRDTVVTNSGEIILTSNNIGEVYATYLAYNKAGGVGIKRLLLNNTGSISVTAPSVQSNTDIGSIFLVTGDTSLEVAEINNSGQILLQGGEGRVNRAAINLSGGSASNFFVVNNASSGEIISADINPIAIETRGASSLTLSNYGVIKGAILGGILDDKIDLYHGNLIVGNIDLAKGNDVINLLGGRVEGTINAGEGDDQFNWSGGKLYGSFNGGDGSDRVIITSDGYTDFTILDGGDDLSAMDGFIDTLIFQDFTYAVKGANLLNWEQVAVGNGSISFTDDALATGSETGLGLAAYSGGVISVGSYFSLAGNLELHSGGVFVTQGAGTGFYKVSSDFINAGHLNLSDASEGDLIEVAGNYIGKGGLISIDTHLYNDNSATDVVKINGDTNGSSDVKVHNIAGHGALTTEGIKIVQVNGTSAGVFSLQGDYIHEGEQAVVGGAYAYKLYKGSVSEPDNGNWYLRSTLKSVEPEVPVVPTPPEDPLYQPGVPTYESYAQSLLGLNGVSSLQQRVGNRFWAGNGNRVIAQGADAIEMLYAAPEEAGALVNGNGVWGRIEGAHNKIDPRFSTSNTEYNQNVFKLQAGVDGLITDNEEGTLIGGVFVQYVHGKTKTKSVHGDGEISTDGYGLGGTLTWYGNKGFYVDAQAQATWYDSDLSSRIANLGFTSGNDGFGYALSVETGKRFAIDPAWSVTPQVQLVYSHVDFDSFTDVFDAAVRLDRGKSLQGRLGITLDHENSWQNDNGMTDRAHVYGIANLYYEFLNGTRVDVANTSFASKKDRLWAGVGVGGSYNWNDDKYSVYGEGIVNTSLSNFGDSYTLKGNVGFRVKW